MNTILTVRPEDLKLLDAKEAVALFRELLWAEAVAVGIGKDLINVPSAITTGDGGIDAEVGGVAVSGGQGVIRASFTAYQIKTGNFSIGDKSNVNGILCKPRSSTVLQPRVKACLDKGGTLVVVLFGWDGPEKSDGELVTTFQKRLADFDPMYATASIAVWRPNQIAGFLRPYPGLCMKARRLYNLPLQTHAEWARWKEMGMPLQPGAGQETFITDLASDLRSADRPVHVRVTGEPGIGKTRLVLEATRPDDIAPLTLYFPSPQDYQNSDLATRILLPDDETRAVFVVDECEQSAASAIWNRMQAASPRIKLITIFGDPETTSGGTTYRNPPLLASPQISAIIEGYGIPADQADRWVSFCSGSPRVAHVIGQNLKQNPEDLLRSPDTVSVWERYLTGNDTIGSETFQKRKNVLLWLSLFKRFGYGAPFAEEARLIAGKIECEEGYTWREFQRVIADLRDRKILQGQTTLYITPKLLHIWLWTQWWETYGNAEPFDLDRFTLINPKAETTERLSDALVAGFHEMFRYATGSRAAAALVGELLGPEGPFSFDFLNTGSGSRFFRVLAEADPPCGLACLRRVIGASARDALLDFAEGRRAVVWALEGIGMWRPLFADAARLLLALAEAENESWSNNASGVFTQLFVPAPAPIAPTEASPEERFPVLQEALASPSSARRKLALRACERALQSQGFSRTVGAERQGLRQEPQLWKPVTWDELFDAYSRVWNLVVESLDQLPEEERQEAVRLLVDSARSLSASYPNLVPMVIETLDKLVERPDVDTRSILARAIETVRYGQSLPEETLEAWRDLRERLTGSDFPSLLRRYAGMSLLEDQVDEEGNSSDVAGTALERLAQQAVEQPSLLEPELSWLMTNEAKNGYTFGHALGMKDAMFSLLPTFSAAVSSAGSAGSLLTLSGYLRAYRERSEQEWEDLMDSLADGPDTAEWVPELTWRAGNLSDRSASRILRLVRDERVSVQQFGMFTRGGTIRGMSDGKFREWIEFMVGRPEPVVLSAALDLYDFYYRGDKQEGMPEDLTARLLTHPAFLRAPEDYQFGTMDDYHWTEIGKRLIERFPGRSLELADAMLASMGEDGAITGGFRPATREVLDTIVRNQPAETWGLVIRYIGPPLDLRAFHICSWLHGEDMFNETAGGALEYIPSNAIWSWVDADIENRAWYVATIVPKQLFREEARTCLSREMLVRYGEREDVRVNFSANYFSGGWRGPESLHYRDVKRELLEFRKSETDRNVLMWVDEYLEELEASLKLALAREERRD